MKKIIIIVTLMMLMKCASSQVKIFGDSTRIYSGRAGAFGNELRLMNASRGVFHGLLTNIDSNGLTKWIRPYMIDSFTLVIGDTFHLSHGTSGSSIDSITLIPGTNISIPESHTQAIGSHPSFTINSTATQWRSPFSASFGSGGTVPIGTNFAQITGRASGYTSVENQTQFVVANTSTGASLFISTSGTQPGTGSMVITLRVNGASTALTVTIPAGSSAGSYSDITHTVSINAGDKIDWQVVNNASSAAPFIISIGASLTGNF